MNLLILFSITSIKKNVNFIVQHTVMMKTLLKNETYLGLCRYLLGLTMIPYAVSKISKSQFIISAIGWTTSQPLEDLPSTYLAWAFLGHSAWFQILLGILELIPALLLLFRKTALLGACLMLPMTTGVFLINYALDLWDGTKIISVVLLLLNLLVFVFEWNRIKLVLLLLLNSKLGFKFVRTEVYINITIVAVIFYYVNVSLLDYKNQTNELTGDWIDRHPIEWILEKEEALDTLILDKNLKIYFGANGNFQESGDGEGYNSYKLNERHDELILSSPGKEELRLRYVILGNSLLKISGMRKSGKHSIETKYFRKRIINKDKLR